MTRVRQADETTVGLDSAPIDFDSRRAARDRTGRVAEWRNDRQERVVRAGMDTQRTKRVRLATATEFRRRAHVLEVWQS